MSEEHLNPNHTPDGLDGNPASGVKRMNKLPLAIAGVIALVVIVVLAFAASQRANKGQDSKEVTQEEVAPRSTAAGANAILQGYGVDGEIPARQAANRQSSEPAPAEPGETTPNPPPAPETAPTVPDRGAPPARTAQMSQEDRQRLQRVRQFREDLFYDAVVADTAIQLPGNQDGGNANGGLVPGALGADGMAEERQRRRAQAMAVSAAGGGNSGGGAAGLGGLAGLGGGTGGDSADPNLRARKDEFRETERRYGYSTEFRQAQLTPYEVRVGSVIPAVMIGGINSDLPGEIIAQVSQNVRDTRTGQHILIPQGSRLIGTYDSHIAMGQRRVMVGWHRLQFPDGSTMEIGNMGGTDPAGYAGFNDKVNNHYWRIFGNATLLSIIGAGAQLSQPDSDNNSNSTNAREELAAELGRQWGQVGQEMTRRNMNIQPTLEIRPGYQFNVMVNKDLILEPYEPMEPGR